MGSLTSFIDRCETSVVKPKMTEAMMQYALYQYGHLKPLYPNIHYGCNEWDGLHISNAGYLTCYEIKLSRSDFKADFKKDRHYLLTERLEEHPEKMFLKLGLLPKHVYYVCHGFKITEEDVPDYAGLLLVDERGFTRKVKDAPVLWKKKVTSEQIQGIYKTLANRYIYKKLEDQREKMHEFRIGVKEKNDEPAS